MTPSRAAVGLLLLAAGCDLPGQPKGIDPSGRVVPVRTFQEFTAYADASGRDDRVDDFKVLFGRHCAGCHGADGTTGPAPPLNDPTFLALVPDAEVLQVITAGRPGTPMPAFDRAKGGTLTAAQVKILAEGLKKTWAPKDSPADAPAYLASGAAGDAGRGKGVFARACAGCHGEDGKGGPVDEKTKLPRAGALNEPAFLALASDQLLRRIAITGRPDLGMPTYAGKEGRPADFAPLTGQDVADVVALLASWRAASPARK